MIVEEIKKAVSEACKSIGIKAPEVNVEHPADSAHGDYSTNIALVLAKQAKERPRDVAEKIATVLRSSSLVDSEGRASIERVEVAPAGFINFHLSAKFFSESLEDILKRGDRFGRNEGYGGKTILVEYTDPNPFKEFHIGHLMSNAVGESLSRLFDFCGAKVSRASYQGDVGLHVAKAVWGIIHDTENLPRETDSISSKINFLATAYVSGSARYEEDENAKKEIIVLNKKIFERTDPEVNAVYDTGRAWSLAHFEEIYKKLGTHFDYYFFESETGVPGEKIVRENIGQVFTESEGAIVFHGEKHDPALHTRVFINKEGLPTYEAKELGLAKLKQEKSPSDLFVSITGNEVNDYFKVVLRAMHCVLPDIASKIKHLSHGMLRMPGGKMSSRKGNVVTGESLISAVQKMVSDKMESRELPAEEKEEISSVVAIGAIKYSILRQAVGGDIIFDQEKSISFEGDSGPYLQYSYVRAVSVLRKAEEQDVRFKIEDLRMTKNTGGLEKLLYRFPEVVERAANEYEPHYVATYLIELAGAFNRWYANNQIIGSGAEEPYRLGLTKAFSIVTKNGLWLLGIKTPDKM